MSIRVLTDGNNALLYDSVEGTAVLTPIFDDREFFSSAEAAALDFANFVEQREDGVPAYRVGPTKLRKLRDEWEVLVEHGGRTEA